MSGEERVYRAILCAYPRRFRQSYALEMLLVFRDQRRDGVVRDLRYWAALVIDVVRTAPREWRDDLATTIHSGGRPMKRMAIIAVFVTAFELVNTASELQAGGFAGRGALSQTGFIFVILGALALLISGIALLRRGRAAVPLVRIAAVCCLASFAFVGFASPVFSRLAMLAGIGYPVALLAWLFVNADRGTAARTIAS